MGGNTAGLSLDLLPPSSGPKALHLRESWACPVPRLRGLRGTGSASPKGRFGRQDPRRLAGGRPWALFKQKAAGGACLVWTKRWRAGTSLGEAVKAACA